MRSSRQLPRRTVTNIDLTVDRTSLVAELEQIERVKDRTTRKCLIDARLGQGQFRVDVEKLWRGACGVTGCRISAVLRASHIKPWSQSNNKERLDPENGILLAAHIDALFDRGLITFLEWDHADIQAGQRSRSEALEVTRTTTVAAHKSPTPLPRPSPA